MKSWVVLLQVVLSFSWLMMGADFSEVDGRWAERLHLPLSGLAGKSYLLAATIPILFLLLGRPRSLLQRMVIGNLIGVAFVPLPVMILELGSQSLALRGEPDKDLLDALSEDLPYPTVIVGRGRDGWKVYFPRSVSPSTVHAIVRAWTVRQKANQTKRWGEGTPGGRRADEQPQGAGVAEMPAGTSPSR